MFPSATGRVNIEQLGLKELPQAIPGRGLVGIEECMAGQETQSEPAELAEPTPAGPAWSDGKVIK